METEVINWAEVLVALALRLVGVFVVLAFLMVSIQISGALITRARQGRVRAEGGQGKDAAEDGLADSTTESAATAPNEVLPEEETAAAIALALDGFIRQRAAASRISGPAPFPAERDGAWRILGRQEALLRDAPWKDPMRRRAWTFTGNREP